MIVLAILSISIIMLAIAVYASGRLIADALRAHGDRVGQAVATMAQNTSRTVQPAVVPPTPVPEEASIVSTPEQYDEQRLLEGARTFQVHPMGNLSATREITLVVFEDPLCSYCRAFHDTLEEIKQFDAARIHLVTRHYSIFGEDSIKLAALAECGGVLAGAEGYRRTRDHIYRLSRNVNDVKTWMVEQLALDAAALDACAQGEGYEHVMRDSALARELNLGGTPSVFLGGKLIGGYMPAHELRELIEAELQNAPRNQ